VPINIRFLWEFEEEIGSPNFESIISKARSNLKTDSVVVSDTVWVSRRSPCEFSGLRGLLGFLLRLETGEVDTHSGETGGASRNPIAELMRLVCDLYDPATGKIKIKGFYDDIIPPTKRELNDWANCGFNARAFKKAHHLKLMRSDDPLELMKAYLGNADFRSPRRGWWLSGARREVDRAAASGGQGIVSFGAGARTLKRSRSNFQRRCKN
jgi:acetylornithine deacetylase/succinyl-diaminopimelate desuccinylase-like protein